MNINICLMIISGILEYTKILTTKKIEFCLALNEKKVLGVTGCLPNFWHRLPWLFFDFFLVSLTLYQHLTKFFPSIYPPKIRKFWNLSKFWFTLLFLKKISWFHWNSLTFHWLFTKFPDFSLTFQGIKWIPWLFPDLADTL